MNFNLITYREDFTRLIDELGLSVALEIGIGLGENAFYLLENSNIEKLYCIDNFSVRGYAKHKDKTLHKFKSYGDRVEIILKDSVEAVEQFTNESLDYIYIDGDHRYKGVKKDLELWYSKVRRGGFFGGHDYRQTKGCGVPKAVDQFFADKNRTFNLTQEANQKPYNKSWWIIK